MPTAMMMTMPRASERAGLKPAPTVSPVSGYGHPLRLASLDPLLISP